MQNQGISQPNSGETALEETEASAVGNGAGSQAPYITVKSLWKVFGRNPERVLQPEYADKDKSFFQSEFGNVVGLRDVNFDVRKGETFVIMGLSGSGKSTLVRCLLRLIDPTSGEVVIDGEDITKMNDKEMEAFRRAKIAMVFQHYGLLPHRNVLDNAAWGLEVQGVPREDRRERAAEVLRVVGLDGWEDYRPAALSGGMQQRVGLARALACDPEILLMDEPFSALDPLIRRDMQNELIRLQEQLHKTIIFITHDLAEATKLGSRIAIMRDGAIVQIGTPEEILANPADDYVADFTRDVRTCSIVTVGYVMAACADRLDATATPQQAIALLDASGAETAFVVMEDGAFGGEISRAEAERAAARGDATIEGVLCRRCAPVRTQQSLEDALADAWSHDGDVPVVDEAGRLVGTVERDALAEAVFSEEREEAGV
jgi:glycine betaine/proline transport system ATP-binding protein